MGAEAAQLPPTETVLHDADRNHQADYYSDAFIRTILRDCKVIAMVGASANWNRPSYFAMKYLQQKGYRVIPVNPGQAGKEILGETVYAGLGDIPVPVDMVDVFRNSAAAGALVEDAIASPATIFWLQLGVVNHAGGGQGRSVRHEGGDEPLPQDRICAPVGGIGLERHQQPGGQRQETRHLTGAPFTEPRHR